MKWIDTKESLPTVGSEVLVREEVYGDDFTNGVWVNYMLAFLVSKSQGEVVWMLPGGEVSVHDHDDRAITHWMKIEEPVNG